MSRDGVVREDQLARKPVEGNSSFVNTMININQREVTAAYKKILTTVVNNTDAES